MEKKNPLMIMKSAYNAQCSKSKVQPKNTKQKQSKKGYLQKIRVESSTIEHPLLIMTGHTHRVLFDKSEDNSVIDNGLTIRTKNVSQRST